MPNRLFLSGVCASLLLLPIAGYAQKDNQNNNRQNDAEQQNNPNTWSGQDAMRIVREVRHKLLGLPDYDVFDSLSFGIQGRTIILNGYASRPILKSEAQNAVKGIPGVASVDNQIKVLPNSLNDDRIRMGVYRRVYNQPMLRRYIGSPVGFGRFPSVAMEAGGITQDPPLGYHAIHIIVDNGHVILTGVVDNESDAAVAAMQANLTPGAFSVSNELQIAGQNPNERKK
jgi:hyperosmotically inducible protein